MRQLAMMHLLDNVPAVEFEKGFSIRNYRKGEEEDWLAICRCGLSGPDSGPEVWKNAIEDLIAAGDDLVPERDIFFVVDENDRPVATITAFIRKNGTGDIHMVAAKNEVRGHHIGEAMLSAAMQKLDRQMQGKNRHVHLTTDDFRKPAIVGYLRGGFHPIEYDEGMPERWRAVCDEIGIHGVEMLDEEGKGTGIIL